MQPQYVVSSHRNNISVPRLGLTSPIPSQAPTFVPQREHRNRAPAMWAQQQTPTCDLLEYCSPSWTPKGVQIDSSESVPVRSWGALWSWVGVPVPASRQLCIGNTAYLTSYCSVVVSLLSRLLQSRPSRDDVPLPAH